ncbi:MAG: D-aminoacyl-tRNA deacylase [Akkermansiaceae bacterium]
MRTVLQRVSEASVTIDGEVISAITNGFLILLGIEEADGPEDIAWLVRKITKMRVFEDSEGKMNQSLLDHGGQLLVVSQFTLHASIKKGNRPSFINAARPDQAEPLYLNFCTALEKETGQSVGQGKFGAEMKVALINDGPVTIIIDSRNRE